VTANRSVRADELELVRLARGGDQRAFGELAVTYRTGLLAHCYRLTGSVADAEDALQEGLLRAWRGLAEFEGRGSVRSWLYAIVTNSALDVVRHRSRRELPVAFGPPASPGPANTPIAGHRWLDPFPARWLAGDARLSQEARYELRESIEVVLLVALRHLPALQRAVLLLREVVGFSAAETAAQLGTTAAAVNSALQRARAAIRGLLAPGGQQQVLATLGDHATLALARQYADAIEDGDDDTLISMLTADAAWSMPPAPTCYRARQAELCRG